MSAKLCFMASSALLLASLTAFRADAGHREGNGGDYIRATFIDMGRAVVQHLETTADGQAFTHAMGLDPDALAGELTIDVVKVSDTPLSDNGGSRVDALGEPGHITLYHDAWAEHFEKDRDVYFLVLHELLRAKGVADDDYVISGGIRPFPAAERIATSIGASVPYIAEDDVSAFIDITKLVVDGDGCPSGFGTLVDFDVGRNALGLRFSDFVVDFTAGMPLNMTRKICTVSLQTRQLPPGTMLVANQIDAAAEIDLPSGAAATLTGNAYIAGTVTASTQTKTVSAGPAPLAGRTLLRGNSKLMATACGSGPKLLDVSITGRVTSGVVRVLGASVYLKLVPCTP